MKHWWKKFGNITHTSLHMIFLNSQLIQLARIKKKQNAEKGNLICCKLAKSHDPSNKGV